MSTECTILATTTKLKEELEGEKMRKQKKWIVEVRKDNM